MELENQSGIQQMSPPLIGIAYIYIFFYLQFLKFIFQIYDPVEILALLIRRRWFILQKWIRKIFGFLLKAEMPIDLGM